jgi:TonB family protein
MCSAMVRPRWLAGLVSFLLLGACSAPESAPADTSLSAVPSPRGETDGTLSPPSPVPAGESADTIIRPRLPVVEPSRSLCDAPAFSPRNVEPSLEAPQRRVLTRYFAERYPVELSARGDTTRVVLWVCLDTEGSVQNTAVVETSGRAEFDRLAEEALRAVHFSPAIHRGERVPAWIQIPVRYP